MPSSPKILHIVYSLIRGGSEGQCALTAMMLNGQYGTHRVAAFDRTGYYLERVESACGPVYEIPIRTLRSLRTWREVSRLTAWIKEQQFDLVHAWDADAIIFGSLAALRAGVPFITSHRDTMEIYANWKLRCMGWADRRARAVVVNAQAIIPRVERLGVPTESIQVIGNMFDVDEFDRLAQREFSMLSRLPAGRRVGMVCRLDEEKDPLLFVEAAAAVGREFADAVFVLAGDGPQFADVEERIATLGIRDKFVCLGEVNDVPALLKCLELGVLVPRANEGLSNSILEYMAAGIPVVATRCGGNAELVIEGETGLLADPGDTRGVAHAMNRILSEAGASERLGSAGRSFVQEHHSPGRIGAEFEELYRSCLLA